MSKYYNEKFAKESSRNETKLETVLDILSKEIYKHGGRGFTVEVNAEVTKYKIKKSIMWTSFWSENTDVKYIHFFNNEKYNKADLDISISKELENKLPSGITITKTTPVILYDTRDFRQNRLWNYIKHKDELTKFDENEYFELDNPEIVEGRRVYLTVTDEYASKILRTAYVAECSFRSRLLIKYYHILKDIAVRMNLSKQNSFEIECDNVCYGYGYYDPRDPKMVSFEEFEMESLSSRTQLYGMALAILEMLEKDTDCIGSKINCTISYESGRGHCVSPEKREIGVIHVWYDRRDKPVPPKKELKSWD